MYYLYDFLCSMTFKFHFTYQELHNTAHVLGLSKCEDFFKILFYCTSADLIRTITSHRRHQLLLGFNLGYSEMNADCQVYIPASTTRPMVPQRLKTQILMEGERSQEDLLDISSHSLFDLRTVSSTYTFSLYINFKICFPIHIFTSCPRLSISYLVPKAFVSELGYFSTILQFNTLLVSDFSISPFAFLTKGYPNISAANECA